MFLPGEAADHVVRRPRSSILLVLLLSIGYVATAAANFSSESTFFKGPFQTGRAPATAAAVAIVVQTTPLLLPAYLCVHLLHRPLAKKVPVVFHKIWHIKALPPAHKGFQDARELEHTSVVNISIACTGTTTQETLD
jgi:hypothetical protein